MSICRYLAKQLAEAAKDREALEEGLELADDAIDAICMHVHAMDVGRVRLVSKAWRGGMPRGGSGRHWHV